MNVSDAIKVYDKQTLTFTHILLLIFVQEGIYADRKLSTKVIVENEETIKTWPLR